MLEVWTAESKTDDLITFSVRDETTGETRTEERYSQALPLMFAMGGYPTIIGVMMSMQELPWRFRKDGDSIYIDGPPVGVDDYHPIK